jgi:steroid 5-alpha reductase family enzyme
LALPQYFGCAAIFLSSSVPFATSAGGGGDERVATVATALGFFAISVVEMVDDTQLLALSSSSPFFL